MMVFVLFNSMRREVVKSNSLDSEIKRLQGEIESLDKSNNLLMGLTQEIGDLDFLENEARVKMGMKLPGETVVVIDRATSTFGAEESSFAKASADAKALADRSEDRQSIWNNPRKWSQYFFNHGTAPN